jgi:potassium/hydrogen antiporter
MASIAFANALLLLGALLVLAGIASSLIAKRFGAPLLLVFLLVGMLAGEDGPGGVHFNDYNITYLVGSFALAVILFDGGLRTKFATLRKALAPSLILATLGVLITAGLTGLVAWAILPLSLAEGLLMGAIIASTDAAAVFFLLRSGGMQLKHRVGATLEIESGTNDPVAVFLTLVIVEVLVTLGAGGHADIGWHVAVVLGQQLVVGAAVGISGGLLVSWLMNRIDLPSGMHPLFVVAAAVMIYGLAAVADGSGFLAVYLAGLVIGNRPLRAAASIMTFHDTATWMCQIVMFLLLGLLVTPSTLILYAWPALAIAMFLMLVGRPLAVWLCLLPFHFTRKETAFIAWVGLRGAVSIFLAAIPQLTRLPHAEVFFNVAFFVVLVSLLVQGWTITLAGRRLGMALPRAAASVQRAELDIPGQSEHEMVGYPILPESRAAAGELPPAWARPMFVARDGALLAPLDAGVLKEGDYAYFLAPIHGVQRLDAVFAEASDAVIPKFGEFMFAGDVPIASLAALYGLTFTEEERDFSLSSLIAERFDGQPQLGDQLQLGGALLVVRGLEEGVVTRVGMILQAEDAVRPPPAGLAWLWRLRQRMPALRLPSTPRWRPEWSAFARRSLRRTTKKAQPTPPPAAPTPPEDPLQRFES